MEKNFGDLMKQAKKLQEDMEKAQKELTDIKIIGEAGGGVVKIMMTGRHMAKKVHIDARLLEEEKDMLEDLVAAAINDAVNKVDKMSRQKMMNLAQGMGLPPDMQLPDEDKDKG